MYVKLFELLLLFYTSRPQLILLTNMKLINARNMKTYIQMLLLEDDVVQKELKNV